MFHIRPILLCAALAAPPSWAQEAADWEVRCENGNCAAGRDMRVQATGEMFARVTFIVPKEGRPSVAAQLPLGVAIEPGVRLLAGDEVFEAPIDVCFPDGCRAVLELKPGEVGPLLDSDEIEIRFFAFGNERPLRACPRSG